MNKLCWYVARCQAEKGDSREAVKLPMCHRGININARQLLYASSVFWLSSTKKIEANAKDYDAWKKKRRCFDIVYRWAEAAHWCLDLNSWPDATLLFLIFIHPCRKSSNCSNYKTIKQAGSIWANRKDAAWGGIFGKWNASLFNSETLNTVGHFHVNELYPDNFAAELQAEGAPLWCITRSDNHSNRGSSFPRLCGILCFVRVKDRSPTLRIDSHDLSAATATGKQL